MKNRAVNIRKKATVFVVASVLVLALIYWSLPLLIVCKIEHEIDEAFGLLNKKLEKGRNLITTEQHDVYLQFEQKKEVFKVLGKDLKLLELWENKALQTKSESAKIIGYILNDANEMIKLAEKKDWVMNRDAEGNILSLLPLNELTKMDDYQIPTVYFLGKSGDKFKPDPYAAGLKLINAIHAFRDNVTENMGTYEYGQTKYSFKAPKDPLDLQSAFNTCNPADTSSIGAVFRLLSFPDKKVEINGVEVPYVSIMFFQTPIIGVCAVLTSLTVDVRLAEKRVVEFFISKIDE